MSAGFLHYCIPLLVGDHIQLVHSSVVEYTV